MAKWYGVIGFAATVEEEPGIWVNDITERYYYGDVLRNSRRLQNSANSTNDDITVSNEISILSDPYANDNFHTMRYVEFMNAKWKITNVEVQYPRLVLTIGGVWNGEQA